MNGLIFAVVVLLLFGLGLYVSVAMGLGALLIATVLGDREIWSIYGYVPWNTMNSFAFVALPLFIMMGELLVRSGTSAGMYNALARWFNPLPGGLLHTNVVACAVFASVSGSSAATAATISRVALPSMRKYNYNERIAVGSLASAGTLGLLIPPSITFIIYGLMAEQSIGKLYLAAFIPGVVMTVAYMVVIAVMSMANPAIAPSLAASTWRERFASLAALIPIALLMLLVLGTIYMGVATATEAAAFGVSGAFVIALLNKRVNRRMLRDTFLAAAGTTAMIMLVLIGAFILQFVLAMLGIPGAIAKWVIELGLGPMEVILMICVVYLVLGTFMEELSMIVMTIPIFLPMLKALGIDLVWFGVIVVILVCAAIISPPVGINLFVVQNLRKQIAGKAKEPPIADVFIGVLPFFAATVVVLGLIIAFPQIALWLPGTAK